jgi:predicted DNA-binding protein
MSFALASLCCRHAFDTLRNWRISNVPRRRLRTMADNRVNTRRRRAGRPPAGATEGERVKDYPQLSIRVPLEMKARLNALSVVTGLAQWRVIVEAIDCFVSDLPATDRELVDGLSARLMRAPS